MKSPHDSYLFVSTFPFVPSQLYQDGIGVNVHSHLTCIFFKATVPIYQQGENTSIFRSLGRILVLVY